MKRKALILAAGENLETSDVLPKLLLKHPLSKKTILDKFEEFYLGNTHYVIGFRALSILNEYPKINCTINDLWALTKSTYSLSLALSSYSENDILDIYPGDVIIEDQFFEKILENNSNKLIVISDREKRGKNSLNLEFEGGKIKSSYSGLIRSPNDPEAIGILRCSVKDLKKWIMIKQKLIKNLFVSELIPNEELSSFQMISENGLVYEINTAFDYYRLMKFLKNS